MKTFQEFRLILERYYTPDEALPSGRTPVQKAEKKGIKGHLLDKVKRGADNPNWDTSPHPDYHISSHGGRHDRVTSYTHIPTGMRWYISHNTNRTIKGKLKNTPVHEVGLDIPKHPDESLRSRMSKITLAKRMWRDEIAPRAPHGSIIHSVTKWNDKRDKKTGKRKYTRDKIYREEGMGPIEHGSQWGLVGRNPSPRQKEKGKSRLNPVRLRSSNLQFPPIRGIERT